MAWFIHRFHVAIVVRFFVCFVFSQAHRSRSALECRCGSVGCRGGHHRPITSPAFFRGVKQSFFDVEWSGDSALARCRSSRRTRAPHEFDLRMTGGSIHGTQRISTASTPRFLRFQPLMRPWLSGADEHRVDHPVRPFFRRTIFFCRKSSKMTEKHQFQVSLP